MGQNISASTHQKVQCNVIVYPFHMRCHGISHSYMHHADVLLDVSMTYESIAFSQRDRSSFIPRSPLKPLGVLLFTPFAPSYVYKGFFIFIKREKQKVRLTVSNKIEPQFSISVKKLIKFEVPLTSFIFFASWFTITAIN